MEDYGIGIWSDDNFIIEDGLLKVNYGNKPALIDMIKEISQNEKGPLLF